VLLIDDTTQFKEKYPCAVVIETKTCDDGLVRSATVKTSDGFIRECDVRKLVMLEEVNQPSQSTNEYVAVLDEITNNPYMLITRLCLLLTLLLLMVLLPIQATTTLIVNCLHLSQTNQTEMLC